MLLDNSNFFHNWDILWLQSLIYPGVCEIKKITVAQWNFSTRIIANNLDIYLMIILTQPMTLTLGLRLHIQDSELSHGHGSHVPRRRAHAPACRWRLWFDLSDAQAVLQVPCDLAPTVTVAPSEFTSYQYWSQERRPAGPGCLNWCCQSQSQAACPWLLGQVSARRSMNEILVGAGGDRQC